MVDASDLLKNLKEAAALLPRNDPHRPMLEAPTALISGGGSVAAGGAAAATSAALFPVVAATLVAVMTTGGTHLQRAQGPGTPHPHRLDADADGRQAR